MNKTIASLLVASAFCVSPILTSAQDLENTTPSLQDLVQDEPVLQSAPSIDELVEDESISASTSFFDEPVEFVLESAPIIDELAQEQVVLESAPSADGPAQTEVGSESTPSVNEPVQGAALESPPSTDELAQAVATLESAPSIDEPAQAVAVLERDEPAQAASAATDMAGVNQMISKLENMTGKEVIDQNGEFLGTITGIDEETNLAEVGLANGGTIALMPDMLTDMGNGVVAADLTGGDAVADVDLSDS